MSVRSVTKDVVLGVAAVAGLACILWLLASTFLGLRMLVFQTGSMAPPKPPGPPRPGGPLGPLRV